MRMESEGGRDGWIHKREEREEKIYTKERENRQKKTKKGKEARIRPMKILKSSKGGGSCFIVFFSDLSLFCTILSFLLRFLPPFPSSLFLSETSFLTLSLPDDFDCTLLVFLFTSHTHSYFSPKRKTFF